MSLPCFIAHNSAPQMHHMQQEFQVLTAKIGGLEEKRKERKSNMKPPGEWWANQFSYLPKVQMK